MQKWKYSFFEEYLIGDDFTKANNGSSEVVS